MLAIADGRVQTGPLATGRSIEEVPRLMRYHGTLYATKLRSGAWVFERNGRVCILWER
ncbi:hypothetical protein G3N55_00200 [Dissulfurirhabdus thermomarina]|uniref:Uncharacterized protein n=1 Tax=Dissulfurirhabdus thermomarina TaxID=1765737 RepID=A0A6N9TJ41_DISTH|nr:hypothetical protein [Dissulfurirhabdus thermomarina]NDY41271.1 hypothetical protein [Dissulfurirhabdus thermomarina]